MQKYTHPTAQALYLVNYANRKGIDHCGRCPNFNMAFSICYTNKFNLFANFLKLAADNPILATGCTSRLSHPVFSALCHNHLQYTRHCLGLNTCCTVRYR